MTIQVRADKVQAGDYLPGIDNGYVIETPETCATLSLREGTDSPYVLPEGTVLITFHTADGEEGYLIVPPETPVTVER